MNRALRGWSAYFRYGNSAHHSGKIRRHALERLALVIAKRHHRTRAYGLAVVVFQSADQLGLINLGGIVVAPWPGRDWREKPNAGGERRR